jgi:hypothetical protein
MSAASTLPTERDRKKERKKKKKNNNKKTTYMKYARIYQVISLLCKEHFFGAKLQSIRLVSFDLLPLHVQ